jgi:hypothetical protein
MSTTKNRLLAVAALSAVLFAGVAHAGQVSWSVGIQAPIGPGASIGTVFSNYPAMPVVVAPAPVVYAPAPVVYTPPPQVVYAPAPVVYAPAPVYVPRRVVAGPVWVGGRWVHPQPPRGHGHDGWHDGRGRWDDRRTPVYEPYRGRDHRDPR